MITRIQKSIVAVLALVMLSVGSASATAHEQPDGGAPLPASGELASKALEVAVPELEALVGGAELSTEPTLVPTVEGSDYYVVSVSIKGEGFDEGSYAAVMIDSGDWTVAQVVQVGIDILDEKSADTTVWLDGTLHDEQHYVVDDAPTGVRAANQNILDCLVSSGVSVVAAGAIVSICVPLCVATVGAGCLACAAGISALGGAYIGKCINQ